jgi:hypothetical protein
VICCLFDPWIRDPRWVKKQDPDPGSGSGLTIPDHISESLEKNFWVKNTKKFLMRMRIRDPESQGMEKIQLRDPG